MMAVRLPTEVRSDFGVSSVRATEINMTPTTEIAMAITVPTVTVSPTNTRATRAACAGSVRE
jgi:hypothetical protein